MQRGLSGGQKVKVVLAAATWRRPHIVILDEPTNYLDRESLAALIEACKAFEGGVLVITRTSSALPPHSSAESLQTTESSPRTCARKCGP